MLVQLVSLPQGRQTLMIMDFEGKTLAFVAQEQSMQVLQCEWASGCEGLACNALQGPGQDPVNCTCIWLWGKVITLRGHCSPAWLAPSSGCLAIAMLDKIVLYDVEKGCLDANVWSEAECLCWGSRLAVLPRLAQGALQGCDRLLLYVANDDGLILEHTVTAGCRLFAPRLLRVSGDGEFCAAVTGFPRRGKLRYCHLAIVQLATGRLREYSLLDSLLADDLDCEELRVRWTPDCTAVLVSSNDGSRNEVFSFA